MKNINYNKLNHQDNGYLINKKIIKNKYKLCLYQMNVVLYINNLEKNTNNIFNINQVKKMNNKMMNKMNNFLIQLMNLIK